METKLLAGFKNQSGTALIVALLMIIVLTLISIASISSSTFEVMLSGNKRAATNAFYSAEGGIQSVTARIENFSLPGNYVDGKYDPFTDKGNKNPTNAKVTIYYDPNQGGSPRGYGYSATNFGFEHYLAESTGEDQLGLGPNKSKCTVQEKVVRIVPTSQGGY